MRKSHMAHLSTILAAGAISLPLLASTTLAFAASPRTTAHIGTQLAELKGSDTVSGEPFGSLTAISDLSYSNYTYGTSQLHPGPGLLGEFDDDHDRPRAVFDLGGLRL